MNWDSFNATYYLRRIQAVREKRRTWRTWWLLQCIASHYDHAMRGMDTAEKLLERESQARKRYVEERWGGGCHELLSERTLVRRTFRFRGAKWHGMLGSEHKKHLPQTGSAHPDNPGYVAYAICSNDDGDIHDPDKNPMHYYVRYRDVCQD